jgi:hypothetical protein
MRLDLADFFLAWLVKIKQRFNWKRFANRITLDVINIGLAQFIKHSIRLHELGDHFHVEAVPNLCHRAYKNVTLVIFENIAHKLTIDLQIIDRELLEITERG